MTQDPASTSNETEFLSERVRLKMFSNWTSNNAEHGGASFGVSPMELAKNGFIHRPTGPSTGPDQVKCVFCSCVIKGWTMDHQGKVNERHFAIQIQSQRSCPFFSDQSPNIPARFFDYRFSNIAHIPAFEDESLRFETFRCWPTTKKQRPDILAASGFFYAPTSGKPDRVVCFMCGKAIYGWEPDDDPLEEHQRISPYCEFMKIKRGEACTIKAVLDICGSSGISEEQISRALKDLQIINGPDCPVSAEQLLKKVDPDCA